MKRNLVGVALLAGASGMAAAQSSLTIFGVMDVNMRHASNAGAGSKLSLSTDGMNGSALGFRGTEDLGGGMAASFWLEGGLQPDTGTASALSFQRKSTLGLQGRWGEIRFGRDYAPSFWSHTLFDPFGTNGVGASINLARYSQGGRGAAGLAPQPTSVRVNNSIGYLLPQLGPFSGQVMYAPGEGSPDGRYTGARVTYTSGPVDVAAAVGRQAVAGGSFKSANVAGSYDVQVAKVYAQFNRENLTTRGEETRVLIGAAVPIGAGQIRLSYVHTKLSGADSSARQLALGYVHFLSKRTALYAHAARIDNHGLAQFSVATGAASPGGPVVGGTSTGFELGVRHAF